ncbi:hypothetical protein FGO68_gene7580 [Halteria grandinella]|uniref:Uncharacterized protein n=1 Tax=Halteria grandinella TaxID=5974 RepID=A0A8J8NZ10_HALGN|nr:hypothetical protein FGO68_gene7580 [Halteria grandinella]
MDKVWTLSNRETKENGKIKLDYNKAIAYMQSNKILFTKVSLIVDRKILSHTHLQFQVRVKELDLKVTKQNIILNEVPEMLCKCSMVNIMSIKQARENYLPTESTGIREESFPFPWKLSYQSRLHTLSVSGLSSVNLNVLTFILKHSSITLQHLTLLQIDYWAYNMEPLHLFLESIANLQALQVMLSYHRV